MRDALIIFVGIILAMLIGSYLFFNGAPSTNPSDAPSFTREPARSFSLIAEGQDSGSVTRRTNYRLQTEEEFMELWTLVYNTGGPARPPIDFSKNEVLAVFDGTHSTGGYAVKVTDVADNDGKRTIAITRSSPGSECDVSPEVTSPFQMVVVPKSTLAIVKEETTAVDECR